MVILHIAEMRSYPCLEDGFSLSSSSLLRDLCSCGPSRPIDLLDKGHTGNRHTNTQTPLQLSLIQRTLGN